MRFRFATVVLMLLGSAAIGGEFAVEFDGQKGHIEVDQYRYDGSYPVTIEAFAQPLSEKKGSVFVDFESAGIGLHLVEGRWAFNVFDNVAGNGKYRVAASDRPADKAKISHIAGVFDEQTVVLYVDGQRQQQQGTMLAKMKPSGLPFFIGANPGPRGAVQERFHGRIDAVRLSKGVLYTKDFQPPTKLEKEAGTLILINLEEGKGEDAKDESGNEHHGKLHGGKWIKVPSNDERQRATETLNNGRLEAARYVIRPAGDDQQPLTLHAESVLKWQNTIDRSVHGNIFVWTRMGRPELVASIFQFYSPRLEFEAEFQSLSTTPLVMQKEGQTVWSPKAAGVELKPFDDNVAPAASKPLRLNQMRELAKQFTAEATEESGETYPLRLLSQPLFRYESTDPQVIDGALFAFTFTTDPEVMMQIEARKSDGEARWMFGFARMNVGTLKVQYRDREVWKADRLKQPYFDKEGVYTLFKNLPLPKAKDKAE